MAGSKKNVGNRQPASLKNRSSMSEKKKTSVNSKSKENIPETSKLRKKSANYETKKKDILSTVKSSRSLISKNTPNSKTKRAEDKNTLSVELKSKKNQSVFKTKSKKESATEDKAAEATTTENVAVYEVEGFLDEKVENGQTLFLVKWKNWSMKYNTWEPKSNLTNCERLFKEYQKRREQIRTENTPDSKTPNKRGDNSAIKVDLIASKTDNQSNKKSSASQVSVTKCNGNKSTVKKGGVQGGSSVTSVKESNGPKSSVSKLDSRNAKSSTETRSSARLSNQKISKNVTEVAKKEIHKKVIAPSVKESSDSKCSTEARDNSKTRGGLKSCLADSSFSFRKMFKNLGDFTNEESLNDSSISLSVSTNTTGDEQEKPADPKGNLKTEQKSATGMSGGQNEVSENLPSVLLEQCNRNSVDPSADLPTRKNKNFVTANSNKSVIEESEVLPKQSTQNDEIQDSDEDLLRMSFDERPEELNKKQIKKSKKRRPVRSKENERNIVDKEKFNDDKTNRTNEGENHLNVSAASTEPQNSSFKEGSTGVLNRSKQISSRKRKALSVSNENISPNVQQKESQDQSNVLPASKRSKPLPVLGKNQVPLGIVGALPDESETTVRFFEVKLKNSKNIVEVDSEFMKTNYPQLISDFYAKNIIWKNNVSSLGEIPVKITDAVPDESDGKVRVFEVNLKNSQIINVDSQFMKDHYPQLVMDYYEERITWKKSNPKKNNSL